MRMSFRPEGEIPGTLELNEAPWGFLAPLGMTDGRFTKASAPHSKAKPVKTSEVIHIRAGFCMGKWAKVGISAGVRLGRGSSNLG